MPDVERTSFKKRRLPESRGGTRSIIGPTPYYKRQAFVRNCGTKKGGGAASSGKKLNCRVPQRQPWRGRGARLWPGRSLAAARPGRTHRPGIRCPVHPAVAWPALTPFRTLGYGSLGPVVFIETSTIATLQFLYGGRWGRRTRSRRRVYARLAGFWGDFATRALHKKVLRAPVFRIVAVLPLRHPGALGDPVDQEYHAIERRADS